MYSLYSKPYTNHTLKRSKPYTNASTKPTLQRHANPTQNETKPYIATARSFT